MMLLNVENNFADGEYTDKGSRELSRAKRHRIAGS